MAKTAASKKEEEGKKAGGTTIQRCASNCKNAWMDKRYGKNQRVHNNTTKGARCASCGK